MPRSKIPWWQYALGFAGFVGLGIALTRKADAAELPEHDDTTPAPSSPAPDDDDTPHLLWPVPSGVITSAYGKRTDPVTGKPSGHNGIDLRAPEGTPLRAPGDGSVVKIWTDDLNGHALKIQVGDLTLGFAHLQSVDVQPGATFHAGDVLAHTGGGGPHEGHSTGPHLHITMRDGGDTVDPMQAATWSSQA